MPESRLDETFFSALCLDEDRLEVLLRLATAISTLTPATHETWQITERRLWLQRLELTEVRQHRVPRPEEGPRELIGCKIGIELGQARPPSWDECQCACKEEPGPLSPDSIRLTNMILNGLEGSGGVVATLKSCDQVKIS